MNANDFWSLFLDTGAPEAFLLYNHARKMEKENVSNDSGTCPAGNGNS